MDMQIWGAPLIALVIGGGIGTLVALRSRGDTADIGASRTTDDAESYRSALDSLRALEQQQHKHDPATYAIEREALLARAAAALRRIEDPSMNDDAPHAAVRAHLMAQRDTLGESAVDAAIADLTGTRPASTVSPAWVGALYTLLGVGLLVGLYLVVSSQTVERIGDAPMTGIDPSEMPASNGVAQPTPGPGPVPPEVAALQARIVTNPGDIDARNQLTEFAIGQQDLAEAMAQNGEVMQLDPTNADGRVYRAYLMMSIGRTEEAIGLLETLLQEEPDHVKANVYYGLMSLTADRPAQAIPALERAIATNPDGAEFLRERLAAAQRMLDGGVEAAAPGAAPDPATTPALIASGQLRMEDALVAALQPGDVLFIAVRDPSGGPPLAAQRLEPSAFPMDFAITTADVLRMGGERPLPTLVDVTFRVDRDGNAMTQEDDLPAATVRGLRIGSDGMFVELVVL